MLAATHCLDCGTELSQERWSGGLFPRCLLVMALEESPSSGPSLYFNKALSPRNFRLGVRLNWR